MSPSQIVEKNEFVEIVAHNPTQINQSNFTSTVNGGSFQYDQSFIKQEDHLFPYDTKDINMTVAKRNQFKSFANRFGTKIQTLNNSPKNIVSIINSPKHMTENNNQYEDDEVHWQ